MHPQLRPVARHAARRSRRLVVAMTLGVLFTLAACGLSLAPGVTVASDQAEALLPPAPVPPTPAVAHSLPSVVTNSVPAVGPCSVPEVVEALAAGDDAAVIAAFGGGEAFRANVASHNAPCISLTDPARIWVVINKVNQITPIDYAPSPLQRAQRASGPGVLRADATSALDGLAVAVRESGAGDIILQSGYRAYSTQVSIFSSHVARVGREEAERQSARAGHSEHQLGFAGDVAACGNGGCGAFDAIGNSPQGAWLADNSWRHGFIVRYVDAGTEVTGYKAEPWHLRYIGVDLATAYHEGGYVTLEEFFGLPAAADYVQ